MRQHVTQTLAKGMERKWHFDPAVGVSDEKKQQPAKPPGKGIKWGYKVRLNVLLLVSFTFIVFLRQLAVNLVVSPGRQGQGSATIDIPSFASSETSIASCTPTQLQSIKEQLNPEHESCRDEPWLNRCPVTVATKCPVASWLVDYYMKDDISSQTFLAIAVGCLGGFKSIDLFRMGTRDSSVKFSQWIMALSKVGAREITKLSCGHSVANSLLMDHLGSDPSRKGQVYCVEPLPRTVKALDAANKRTNYESKGMQFHNYFILSNPGLVYQPKAKGLYRCDNIVDEEDRRARCAAVPVTTLDAYVDENVRRAGSINVLQINVDGSDFDVILGGENTLKRTEYLEFVYNWKDRWAMPGRNIATTSLFLDNLGFTCYWSGERKLWRITSCVIAEYDDYHKFWASVSCVNRNLVPLLATEMEQVFLSTMHV